MLLQIFLRNFYGNASCFSLLLLYLGNSQVSVYRTIGPTLVYKQINSFLPASFSANICTGQLSNMFAETTVMMMMMMMMMMMIAPLLQLTGLSFSSKTYTSRFPLLHFKGGNSN